MNIRVFTRTMSAAVRRGAAAATCVVVAGACGDRNAGSGSAPLAAEAIRDSAGITIIMNAEAAPDTMTWRIAPTPSLRLGADESRSGEYLFGAIADATRLSDGRIVVADRQAGDVRVFDATGTFVRHIGRRGAGPGEFRSVQRLFSVGDTIVVAGLYDDQPVQFFTADGDFLRAATMLAEPYGRLSPDGLFTDGTLLVRAAIHPSPLSSILAAEPRVPTPVEPIARILKVDAAGDVVADYGEHVIERSIHYANSDQPGVRLAPSYLAQPQWATADGNLYTSRGDAFEIVVFDSIGELRRIIRKQHTPVEVTRTWVDSYWNATVARMPEELASWARAAPSPPAPAYAPAVDQLMVDAEGNLWVREAELEDSSVRTWFVFDSTGLLKHRVRTAIQPVQIGSEYVLTITKDALGVPSVALHALDKRSPGEGGR